MSEQSSEHSQASSSSAPWWQRGVIYQVYPRSFYDHNGDGIGDLAGIAAKLDYLLACNIDALWVSPFFPSPMHDFGYDVRDYCDVDPRFGTMADFEQLLEQAHQRGLRLILDLVPNHSSSEHPWFVESSRSRDNPKSDWYIWREPAPDGGAPNNWLSCFGGSAWHYHPQRQQYYLHSFEQHQPDLNYQNPEVMTAMLEVMRFWLDKGVDGFRVDVIEFMCKHPDLPDEPEDPDWDGVEPYGRLQHCYSRNQAGVHPLIRQMRQLIDSYDERLLIGEVFVFDEGIADYYGDDNECHLPFNFALIYHPWDAPSLRRLIRDYEAAIAGKGWGNWVLGNHDQHRIASRVGAEQARIAQMLLLTLRGTPTCYYGDEIGMLDGNIPVEAMRDPSAVNQPEVAHIVGRDPERTPMQWDASANAGFCPADAEPWLPVNADYQQRNVAQQQLEPHSMLALFQALTRLRRDSLALQDGSYQELALHENSHQQVIAYVRSYQQERLAIVLNLSNSSHKLELQQQDIQGTLVLSTGLQRPAGQLTLQGLELAANEGVIVRL